MFHLQNTLPYSPKHATILLQRANELVESQASIRDARISKKYIEFDISIQESTDTKTIIARIESITPLASYEEIVERHMEKDGPLRVQYSYSIMNDTGKLMKPLDIYGKMQQGLKRKY